MGCPAASRGAGEDPTWGAIQIGLKLVAVKAVAGFCWAGLTAMSVYSSVARPARLAALIRFTAVETASSNSPSSMCHSSEFMAASKSAREWRFGFPKGSDAGSEYQPHTT